MPRVNGLTDKQRRFIDAYVGEAALNAAKAARIAGYEASRSDVTGHELRKQFRAEIDARLAARSMSSQEVLDRLAAIARNDAAEYIHEGGYIDLKRMKDEGKIHLVKGIKETMAGKVIELFDPQAALGTLAKHHGLLRDQLEVSVLGRLNKELNDLTDAELIAIAEEGGDDP